MRREFQAVKLYVGRPGRMRLDAERTDKGHADWFWAAALLCGAREGQRGVMWRAELEVQSRTVLGI